jgi:Rps23 Pro-64 3,4-dihydroxylase Tpa1-like proline 4-hydroxylase
MFDYTQLMHYAQQHKLHYAAATPYPHMCIDQFMDLELINQIERSVPTPNTNPKYDFYYNKGFEEKWALSNELHLPDDIKKLIHALNSGPFIRFLEALTGIEHLLPDPHLYGAGVHLGRRGGVLQIHSDFNWAAHLQAHRRVNVFLYLNPDWQESWGGALELWDQTCQHKVQAYHPFHNRMIIFSSQSDTFHGHPHPMQCPEDVFRKSIAMYYYTTTRPENELRQPHNTIYKGRDV